MTKKTPKIGKCIFCEKNMSSEFFYYPHCGVLADRQVPCEICGKNFSSLSSGAIIKKIHHSFITGIKYYGQAKDIFFIRYV